MVKYAYDALVYWGEAIEKSIERVARFGYDGIEFAGEPDKLKDTEDINKLLDKHGIEASSICSLYTMERDLASPKEGIRDNAKDYVKKLVKIASELGAKIVIVAPSACGKVKSEAPYEKELNWAVSGIKECGEFAADLGVNLVIEAWNRYETYWVNRLEQALELKGMIGLENVGVMGDLFHMNLEEKSIPEAIKQAGKALFHFHIADSNRAAPGEGHLDFKPIIKALKEIDYDKYLSMELLPASADPFGILEKGGGKEFFDAYTKEAIEYMKAAWESV